MATKRPSFRRVAVALAIALSTAAAQADATDRAVEAPGPLGPLKGSLVVAAAPVAPVAVIVPGSGPTDRDGNNRLGVKGSIYRLLAEGLAARGVTTARIDKRGMFGSAAAIADPNAVTIEDYAGDVRSWAKVLRRETGAACVWVIGHSEGGLVALAASRSGADLCGLVLIAATGRPLGKVIRDQLRANPANAGILDQAESALDSLEAGRPVDTTALHPALQPLFNAKVQPFLISSFALDPAQLIAGQDKPILILQGERDIQVGVVDAQRLHQAAPAAKLVLLPNTNHVLKSVLTADRAANLATYGDASLPLAPGVVDAIADFISAGRP